MKRLLSFVFADVTIPHRVMLAAWLTWAVSYWFVGEAVFKGHRFASGDWHHRLCDLGERGEGWMEEKGTTSILAK